MNWKVFLIPSKESQTGKNYPPLKITLVTHHQYHIGHLITLCTWHSVGWTCSCKFILFPVQPTNCSWDILSAIQDLRKLYSVRWRTSFFFLLLLYILVFFRKRLTMQKCLGEGTTDCVWFIIFFFIAIMKLLENFVSRGKPLYQDEFSYCENVFSSDDTETQVLEVFVTGPCLLSVGKDSGQEITFWFSSHCRKGVLQMQSAPEGYSHQSCGAKWNTSEWDTLVKDDSKTFIDIKAR